MGEYKKILWRFFQKQAFTSPVNLWYLFSTDLTSPLRGLIHPDFMVFYHDDIPAGLYKYRIPLKENSFIKKHTSEALNLLCALCAFDLFSIIA
jgi:hypothetical protein